MDSTEPLSVSDIASTSRLSAPTLSRILNKMLEQKLILMTNKAKSSQGRCACLYELNGDYSNVVGVYINKDEAHIALSDFRGRIISSTTIRTKDAPDGQPLIERICAGIDALQALNPAGEAPRARIRAIGFCVSGRIAVDGSKEFVTAVDIPSWGKIAIQDYISERYHVRCYVEKDTTACLICCKQSMPLRKYDGIVFLNIGIGIGFSVMLGGEIYRGLNGMAGEIRHMALGQMQQNCTTCQGRSGGDETLSSLEKLYGLRNLMAKAYDVYVRGESAILEDCLRNLGVEVRSAEDMKVEYIDLVARYGDHRIIYILYEFIMAWASIITNIACCLATELFIIGGGIGTDTPYIISRLQEQLRSSLSFPINLVSADNRMLERSAACNYTVYRLYRETQSNAQYEYEY